MNFYKEYNDSGFDESGFDRVTAQLPCAICGKTKWCSRTRNGRLALCTKVSEGSIKTARNDAYIHVLENGNLGFYTCATSPLIPRGKRGSELTVKFRAEAERVNEVYTFLLKDLPILLGEPPLERQHSEHLLNERGLGDTTIALNLYASVPHAGIAPAFIALLREQFGDLLNGIPGFYKDEAGNWQMMLHGRGIFIPYRNVQGQITGLQIRSFGKTGKYYWLSTPPDKYPNGTSSGTPVHFVKPDLVDKTGRVIITEGGLKADIISEFIGESCIAIPGVTSTNPDKFAADLRQTLPNMKEVLLAFDMDWQTNEAVKKGLLRLKKTLEKVNLNVRIRTWDIALGKGLDDVLYNKIQGGK